MIIAILIFCFLMVISVMGFSIYVIRSLIGVNSPTQVSGDVEFTPIDKASVEDIGAFMTERTGDDRFTNPATLTFTRTGNIDDAVNEFETDGSESAII